MDIDFKKITIAVIGQGYVGLPLAVEFGKKFNTIGFDINQDRVNELSSGLDTTLEVSKEELAEANHISFTSSLDDLSACNIYIVTVPTPIDEYKNPDLSPLIKASEAIAKVISKGDIVIYESTVFPGATEEECVPIIEQHSGLKFNQDFFAGYSPERINPGDKEHRVSNIKKVTAGSTNAIANVVDDLYKTIICAGTHKASSIKVAEAAKVIENTQRDVNIALINELSLIFNKLKIDTLEVLEAAGTKWNFLPFRPGLVGGHCIGVDPYYLTHKAQRIGYNPEMILAGRRLNDNMGSYIASQLIKAMIQNDKIRLKDARVLILGLTFKENCPDLRNTKVIDIVKELKDYKLAVDILDPWCLSEEAEKTYGLPIIKDAPLGTYDAVIVAVAHNEFKVMGIDKIKSFCKPEHLIYDLKYVFNKQDTHLRL